MSFKMKYQIEKQYLTSGSERRSGIKMPYVGFVVAHDTGNDGSTAYGNVGYYERSKNEMSASAHTFVDDEHIVECIPATTGTPEKAWHVIYNVTTDNQTYGDDANDIAIGVELCYSYQRGSINNKEAYKRYVWYIAYLCYKFDLDPTKHIAGHCELDPTRKLDPYKNALKIMDISKAQFIQDVVNELKDCTKRESLYAVYQNENHLQDFATYADAVEYAKRWANASVRKISNRSWVWTNIQQSVNKEVRKLDANTKAEAMKAIDELAKAGLLASPEYWKERVEENLPVWAYMIIEARKLKK